MSTTLPVQDLLNILIKTDPFEMLSHDVLKTLAGKMPVKTYPPNMYVFKQGDLSLDCLFIVASGLIELTVSGDRGPEMVVGLKRPFDFFGETVVLSRRRYPASARVKESLTCCLVSRKDLEDLMYTYPEFSGFFNTLLAERMRLLYEEIAGSRFGEQSALVAGIESSLFRKRVSEIMSYPVISCRTDDLVTAASKKMAGGDLNAIVALDRKNRPRGILTEKNLVRYLVAEQKYPVETCRVEQVMYSNFVEINPQSFIGQALVAMMRSKTRHLVVVERGELIGMISLVDLIRAQSPGTLLLTRDIESQPDLKGLSLIGREIRNILEAMVAEKATVREILDVMSELQERLTRRVIQLSEERMKRDGWGPPPREYCWINLGSAARYEQMLGGDQDNAMIYADPDPEKREATDAYFERLAELVVSGLEECGFERCPDDIMATDPRWRNSLGGWYETLQEWRTVCTFEQTRTITALLDYRPIWGNMNLAEEFRKKLFEAFGACFAADRLMTREEAGYKLPISFLGTFRIENSGIHKNEMNLKTAAILPLVNGVRLLAVRYGVTEPSTLGRIGALVEKGALSPADGQRIADSFDSMMMLRIRENMKKVKQGKRPDSYVDPYSLRRRERVRLKEALSGLARLLDLINEQFNGFWLKQLA